jgi:predicted nucleic acid-binding protein
MSRLSPKTAEKDVALLQALNLPTVNNPAILQGACRLAIQLEHHVFDTLYHSVALETKDTVLITADHRYLRKAHNLGGLAGLSQWRQVLH